MSSDKIKLPDFTRLWKPSLHILKYVGLAAAVVIVLFLVIDSVIMPAYTRHGTEYPLPDIINKSYDEAIVIAQRYDFEIVIRGRQASPTIPE